MSVNYIHLRMPYGVQCVCGKWPGQHRWGDNACPNPRWRTGNGQPQWLERSFYRANIPTPPRALGDSPARG